MKSMSISKKVVLIMGLAMGVNTAIVRGATSIDASRIPALATAVYCFVALHLIFKWNYLNDRSRLQKSHDQLMHEIANLKIKTHDVEYEIAQLTLHSFITKHSWFFNKLAMECNAQDLHEILVWYAANRQEMKLQIGNLTHKFFEADASKQAKLKQIIGQLGQTFDFLDMAMHYQELFSHACDWSDEEIFAYIHHVDCGKSVYPFLTIAQKIQHDIEMMQKLDAAQAVAVKSVSLAVLQDFLNKIFMLDAFAQENRDQQNYELHKKMLQVQQEQLKAQIQILKAVKK